MAWIDNLRTATARLNQTKRLESGDGANQPQRSFHRQGRNRADGDSNKVKAQAGTDSLGKKITAQLAGQYAVAYPGTSNVDFVENLYRDLLGRVPDEKGMADHLRGLNSGMARKAIVENFLISDEFRKGQLGKGPEATGTPDVAAGGPQASVPPPAGPLNRSLGPIPVEGFNNEKLANFDHQTVKYRFGRVATHFDTSPIRSGAVTPENFLRGMLPHLKEAGLEVTSIKSDTIQLKLPPNEGGGYLTIDVIRDAGPNGACAWWWGAKDQPDAGPGPAPTAVVPGPIPIFKNAPAGPGGPAPAPGTAPGAELATVPYKPEYSKVTLTKNSPATAVLEAAKWVRENHPEFFDKGDDRPTALKMMEMTIGIMRANGYDAHRVVNHPSRPVGDPGRYGSDALVLGGTIFDCYGDFGGVGKPQALVMGTYGDRIRD